MSDMKGFPARMEFTPVPSPFLGLLLREMDDLAELKCALRIFWHLHQKRGEVRWVGVAELLGDPVVTGALSQAEQPATVEALQRVLDRLRERGVLLLVGPAGVQRVLLDTPQNRRQVSTLQEAGPWAPMHRGLVAQGDDARSNIFRLYEENVGLLTPLIAEELKDAEATYPEAWVREAFQEAVRSTNKRSWKYIASILERWAQEGRGDGEPGRRPKEIGAKEYLRRYGAPGAGPSHREG